MCPASWVRFGGADDGSGAGGEAWRLRALGADSEDLPYRVEVWDETGSFPETLVAITGTPSLAYAAFYAAAREFAGRDVTLVHKGATLSRWHGRMS